MDGEPVVPLLDVGMDLERAVDESVVFPVRDSGRDRRDATALEREALTLQQRKKLIRLPRSAQEYVVFRLDKRAFMVIFAWSHQVPRSKREFVEHNWLHCLNHAGVPKHVGNGMVKIDMGLNYFLAGRKSVTIRHSDILDNLHPDCKLQRLLN